MGRKHSVPAPPNDAKLTSPHNSSEKEKAVRGGYP